MAEISIIIVNFNVKYFLEQCIHSVLASTKDEQAEIIIVDNASEDGSVDYISNRFPSVQLISLSKNIGYSAANNLGARRATGSLLLFLNPDTLIPETIFNHAKSFLRQHSQVGALGFRMLDGSGKFLRESKRGKPTLWASFCKFSGFSVLFPSKKAFSGYYLGHLSEKEINEIEVVSGAAFLIEKRVFLKIAGFDERFFMYAEDIDLSQRLIEAGYRNMYLPTVTLIHFKGESSPKNKDYFTNFYGSMALFWQKNAKTPIKRAFLPLLRAILAIFSTISIIFSTIFNKERRKSKKIVPILDPTKVLHPGSTLRYEEVISVIEQKGPSMISAEGSSSMVGSPHKNQRGFAFPL